MDARDWGLNNNTISLDETTVLDVPLETMKTYRGTMGHKANHGGSRETSNARYEAFGKHPRFGRIKCLVANRDIEVDEEICCDYGYEHETVPEWYEGPPPTKG